MVAKRHWKFLLIFACGITLVLALSGCKKESGAPPNEPPSQTTDVTTTTDVEVEQPIEKPEKPPELQKPVEPVKPIEQPPVIDESAEIVPLKGVGPITFGMSSEQVIAQLGQPTRSEGKGIAMYYMDKGITLMFNPLRGLQEINCWSDQYPQSPSDLGTYTGNTKEGIAMGASREKIIAAYGEPDKIDSKGPLEILVYNKTNAQFRLLQGKLVSIKLKAP